MKHDAPQLFGADAAVGYDELVSSGGYINNADCKDYAQSPDEVAYPILVSLAETTE